MIADIERALGSVRGAAEPAPVDDDLDDILDLTEPGGTSPEDVMMADEPITVLEEIVLETEITGLRGAAAEARFRRGLSAVRAAGRDGRELDRGG